MDISAGWGITRVFLIPTTCDAMGVCTGDSVPDANGNIPHSVIKHQMGISAGVVYHARPWLHFDVDGFRADDAPGETEHELHVVQALLVIVPPT